MSAEPTNPQTPGVGAPGPFAFVGYNAEPANPLDGGEALGPPVGGAPALPHDAPPLVLDPDVAAELQLLRQIRDGQLASAAQLAVTEFAPPTITEVDYPIPGVKRWLLPRVPTGGQVEVAEITWGLVLKANFSRIGGTIVNSGTKAVILALTEPASVTPVTGRIYLAAEGGAWDLRLAGITWGGSVSAEAKGGVSQLQVVEV